MIGMEFLKGSAIFGLAVALWDKIKSFTWTILSIVFQRVELTTEDVHEAVVNYLISNYERSKIYDRVYGADYSQFRNGKYALVAYEKFGEKSLLFKSKKRIFWFIRPFFVFSKKTMSFGNENNPNASESQNKVLSVITCIRGTLDFDALILQATDNRNLLSSNHEDQIGQMEQQDRFNIFYVPDLNSDSHHRYGGHDNGLPWFKQSAYRLIGNKPEDLGREFTGKGKALDNLFYPADIKNLIETIGKWVKSKDWYFSKGIPWKRGWLLHGKPGTGKTALVRAFAEDLNLPIYVFSLSQLSNKSFTSAWREMQTNTPCIALIEDFDNVFHGRTNISKNGFFPNPMTHNHGEQSNDNTEIFTPLTFDCLLNCIDGVDKAGGIFTIITTNDITKIDEAIGKPTNNAGKTGFISSRPGRIDQAIELGNITKENKILMAEKFLGEYSKELAEIHKHIETELKETPAQFQELCSQLAVKAYWDSEDEIQRQIAEVTKMERNINLN